MRLLEPKKLLFVAIVYMLSALPLVGLIAAEPASGDNTDGAMPAVRPGAGLSGSSLPDESRFVAVQENNRLKLQADPGTGHFIVTDKTTGHVWRSFPDPGTWEAGRIADVWASHLASPFMFRYVEFNVRKDMARESNFNLQEGTVGRFERTKDGFAVQYELPGLGFTIPVQVVLGEDYVETRIIADGLKDDGTVSRKEGEKDPMARLVSIRLFPFLGAQTSDNEDGFLLIPDGPGALIEFKKHRAGSQNVYMERVYGDDWAFSNRNTMSDRKPVRMPVFGIKSGNQAMIAIIREGEEYASIAAAPSGSFSPYNWVTAEQQYRFTFFQPTDTKKKNGYLTYSKEMTKSNRSTRYFFIEQKDVGYVQMAARYRQQLVTDYQLAPHQGADSVFQLQLHLLGADTKKGFLRDSYLPLTTTEQAGQIVKGLTDLGVDHMAITYLGWQRGGYSLNGGSFPVGSGIGGTNGMNAFVDFAHAYGFSVYLDASSYTYNNTGKDGFRRNRDGLRDLGSSVIGDWVSPEFMRLVIGHDWRQARETAVDGYMFGKGIGSVLNTDFNDKYKATRQRSKQIQQELLAATKQTLGDVRVRKGNFYSLPYASHMSDVYTDSSHDLFVDRTVPFAQIVLHGLVSYSSGYTNVSDDPGELFLRNIEYGAEPSYILTYAPSQQLLQSLNLNGFYSTNYRDWMQDIASDYRRYQEALGDVQSEFIVNHRRLGEGVYETTYANGKRILVNYNDAAYTDGGNVIKAKNFLVIGGTD